MNTMNETKKATSIMFGKITDNGFEFMSEEDKENYTKDKTERENFLYDTISYVSLGGMEFAMVPIELIVFNEKYQRVSTIDYSQIDDLAARWDDDLQGVITLAKIPGTKNFEVIDGLHRVVASAINGKRMIVARIINLPNEEESRIKKAAEIFKKQVGDPLSKADRFNAEVISGTREYVIVASAIKGKKYLISRHIIDNEPNPEKKKEYKTEWAVITGLSAILEAAQGEHGETTVSQVFDILEKANYVGKKSGMRGDIIRAIYKILNVHHNDPEYAEAIANYLVNYDPDIFLAEGKSAYKMRGRGESIMMFLEREVSKSLGIEPVYVGGNVGRYC